MAFAPLLPHGRGHICKKKKPNIQKSLSEQMSGKKLNSI